MRINPSTDGKIPLTTRDDNLDDTSINSTIRLSLFASDRFKSLWVVINGLPLKCEIKVDLPEERGPRTATLTVLI